jgi:hypothetical protein
MILDSASINKIKVISNSLDLLVSEKKYLVNSIFCEDVAHQQSVQSLHDLVYKSYFSWTFSLFFIKKVGGKTSFIDIIDQSKNSVFITTLDSMGKDYGYTYCLYDKNFKYLKFLHEQLSLGNFLVIDQLVDDFRFSENVEPRMDNLFFTPIYIFHDLCLIALQLENELMTKKNISCSSNVFNKIFLESVNYHKNPLDQTISTDTSKILIH